MPAPGWVGAGRGLASTRAAYGRVIGAAAMPIVPGTWATTRRVGSMTQVGAAHDYPAAQLPRRPAALPVAEFAAWPRVDEQDRPWAA